MNIVPLAHYTKVIIAHDSLIGLIHRTIIRHKVPLADSGELQSVERDLGSSVGQPGVGAVDSSKLGYVS